MGQSEYRELPGDFNAIPLTRSLRQEMEAFEPIISFMEHIDNSIDATSGRKEPWITIKLNLDGPKGPELIFEDNGRGMSKDQLTTYIVHASTTSRIPDMHRDVNVLPLTSFINCKLNRFGRGSAATVYFGDFIQIESFKAPQSPEEPYLVHRLDFDYGSQKHTDKYKFRMFAKDYAAAEDELDSGTTITITQLLPEKLAAISGKSQLQRLAKELSQVYYFFIYGFPEHLWKKLPQELTSGCTRPEGGLTITMTARGNGTDYFSAVLGPDSASPGYDSDLHVAMREYERLCQANEYLHPCVSYLRYLPPNQSPLGPFGKTPGRTTPVATPRPAALSSGQERPGTAGPSAGWAGRSSVGPTPVRKGGGGGGAQPGAAGPVSLDDSGNDLDTREIDCVCDFLVIWLYFPYSASARTKPGDVTSELFTFPFWSGKDMVKSKLHSQFPDIYKAAVALARKHQDTQGHAHKLEDSGRLLGLLLVSPDALSHQHKSDFEGKAYELFCKAGPATGLPAPFDVLPRLMTYVWPPGSGPAGMPAGSEAGPSNGGVPDSTFAAGRRGRRSSTTHAGGGGVAGTPARRFPDQAGWHEDQVHAVAANQLHAAFQTWFKMDDDGQLVGPQIADLTLLDLPEPWGFDLASRGMVEYSHKYAFDKGRAPLERGEMVMEGDPIKIHAKRDDHRNAQKMAGHARMVEVFFSQGNDFAKQLFAAVRPWRPHWAPLAALQSNSIMELQVLCAGKLAEEKEKDKERREQEQNKLVKEWESFLPYRLAVLPGEDGPPGAEYDPNHSFDSITVALISAPAAETGGRRKGKQAREVEMGRTQRHFTGYKAAVSMVIEKRTDASSGWTKVEQLQGVAVEHKYLFSGFCQRVCAPGEYRLRFVVDEGDGPRLLDPTHTLEHKFKVTNGQPVRLVAFFLAQQPGQPGGDLRMLQQPPVVRLGEVMPVLAVQLLDNRGARTVFRPDMVERLELPWSAGDAGGGGGSNAGNPLEILAKVHNGDPLSLKLGVRKAAAAAAGGSGAKTQTLTFSADGMTMFVSGLCVEPIKLKQRTPLDMQLANVPHVDVRLEVALRTAAGAMGRGKVSRITTTPAEGDPRVGGDAELVLTSGPAARIKVERGNWFNGKARTDPLTLSKGAEVDNDLALRLVDDRDNPYYMHPGEKRPRVRLQGVREGGEGGRPAPFSFRRQALAANAGGGAAGGSRGRGATSEFVDTKELEFDASGNLLTISGSEVKATGLPGDTGTLTLEPLNFRCPKLSGWVQVRKVMLGVEEDKDDDAEAAAAAAAPRQQQRQERPANGHVRDFVLDGTRPAKRNTKKDLTWADLEKKEEDGRCFLGDAFERRYEYTSSGPRELFIRPCGAALRSRSEVLSAARHALQMAAVVYEQCFVVRPGQLRLGGLRLSLSDEEDDEVDVLLQAAVKVFIGGREVCRNKLTFDNGRVALPELVFLPSDFEVPGRTVAVHVRDAEGRSGSAQAAAAFCYGTFYVRQEPHPTQLRLAPVPCDLLASRPAVTPWLLSSASGGPSSAGNLTPGAGSSRASPPPPTPPPSSYSQPHLQHAEGVLRLPPPSQPAAGSGRGGAAAAVAAAASHLQLLQLQPVRGGGAAVDAATLLAQGFSVGQQCIAVQAGQTLQLPLMVVDQYGLPLPITPALKKRLEEHTFAYLERAQDAATATAVATGGAGGRGPRNQRNRRAASQESEPLDIQGWTWPQLHGSLSADDQGAAPSEVLPVCKVQVRLVQSMGPAVLWLHYDPSTAAPRGATNTAEEEEKDEEAGELLPPLPGALVAAVALQVTHGPLAPGGYQLAVEEPQGVQVQPLSAHLARGDVASQLLPPPPECGRILQLECAELSTLRLAVQLQDAQGCPVSEDGSFELRHLLPHPASSSSSSGSPPPTISRAECRVQRGLLAAQLAIGTGPEWQQAPQLLLLTPKSPNFAHAAARPLAVYVLVKRGRYPVEPLELLWLGGPEQPLPPLQQRALQLTLTNKDPAAGTAAGGEDSGHGNDGGDGSSSRGVPRLPGFKLGVHSADGSRLEGRELQPLRLRYERQVDVDGQPAWVHDPSQPASELQPSAEGGFEARRGEVLLPTRTRTRWRLVAVYEDPRVTHPSHRLQPCPILELELLPGPPCRIALDPECESQLGPEPSRRQAQVVAAGEVQGMRLPELRGCLVDRWGNPSPPPPHTYLFLTSRPKALAATTAAATSATKPNIIKACEVDPHDGSFAMPGEQLSSMQLEAGADVELLLQLEAEGGGGGSSDPGQPELLLRTLYVSSRGDGATLRRQMQELEEQIAAREGQLRVEEGQLRTAEADAQGHRERCRQCRAHLRQLGVQLPAGQEEEGDTDMEDGTAAMEAIDRAAEFLEAQIRQLGGPPHFEDAAMIRFTPGPAVNANASVCLVPRRRDQHGERDYERLRRLAGACAGVPGALGPVVMLGAVERRDVAETLCSYLEWRCQRVYVRGREAATELRRRVEAMRLSGKIMDLENPKLLAKYELHPDEQNLDHPQALLRKQHLRDLYQNVLNFEPVQQPTNELPAQGSNRRRPDANDGFIGFAVNLVVLPPHLLAERVAVRDTRGRGVVQANLRQTMLNVLFQDLMVFETEAHIDAFKARCRAQNLPLETQLIAVDGRGALNIGEEADEDFGERTPPNVFYSGLPINAVAGLGGDGWSGGAVDLRLKALQLRARALQQREGEIFHFTGQLNEASPHLRAKQLQAASKRNALEQLQTQLRPEIESLRQKMALCQPEMARVSERERQQQQQQQGQQTAGGQTAGRQGRQCGGRRAAWGAGAGGGAGTR
ncbi:hypothetical protein Agub_g8198, partial [Astrephomene gubernaculifera]